MVGVAKRIVAGESILKAVRRKTDEEFNKELTAYLVQTHHLDIYKSGFKAEFQIAELPPTLRDEFIARTQQTLLRRVDIYKVRAFA